MKTMIEVKCAGVEQVLQVPINANLGRLACVRLVPEGLRVYGNVIDTGIGGVPKRVRIQSGYPERHGEVVMPGQYRFEWWADEEED